MAIFFFWWMQIDPNIPDRLLKRRLEAFDWGSPDAYLNDTTLTRFLSQFQQLVQIFYGSIHSRTSSSFNSSLVPIPFKDLLASQQLLQRYSFGVNHQDEQTSCVMMTINKTQTK